MRQSRGRGARRPNTARKKTRIRAALWIGCLLAFAVSGLFMLHFTLPKEVSKPARPVYEEIYSGRGEMRALIREVDREIYDSLYRHGVSERDVLFLGVQPRHGNGRIWEFTELLVRRLEGPQAEDILRRITEGLKRLGRDVVVQRVQVPGKNLLCHILLQGYQTHSIQFSLSHSPDVEKMRRPKLAIIIDDLGYDLGVGLALLRLDDALSFAVLPSAPFTGRMVREANQMGRELMLHLPMEPKNFPSVHPGPGALLLGMDDHALRTTLEKDLRQIKGAIGVNNHMGSSFTENREKMRWVLDAIKREGLFYIDSRTTNGTVGYELGKEMGMPVGKRGVFLDNDLDPRAIGMQLERALSMGRHSGTVIGIGHPHAETLEALKDFIPKIRSEFALVRVSQAVD